METTGETKREASQHNFFTLSIQPRVDRNTTSRAMQEIRRIEQNVNDTETSPLSIDTKETSYRAGEGLTINPMGYNREQPINYPQIYALVERDSRMPATAYTQGFRPYRELMINIPTRTTRRRDTDTGATII